MSKDKLFFVAALFLLAIYFAPLLILDYAIVKSKFFDLRIDLIERLAGFLGNGDLSFADLVRLLTGLVTGIAAGFLTRLESGRKGIGMGLWLVVAIGGALLLLVGSHYAVGLNVSRIEEAYPSSDVVGALSVWTTARFRETLALFAVLLGIKSQEFVRTD